MQEQKKLRLHIDKRNGLATVDEFWECDCEKNYVHRKTDTLFCGICASVESLQPDARPYDIVCSKCRLTTEETEELLKWLLEIP